MALSIKDEETDFLVRKLAARRNLSMTQAIRLAVHNELERDQAREKRDKDEFMRNIRRIQAEVAKLPQRMTAEEVEAWMYDENGLPH